MLTWNSSILFSFAPHLTLHLTELSLSVQLTFLSSQQLKDLHSQGFSLLSIDSHGQTALHYGARHGFKDIVRYLIASAPASILDMVDNDRCCFTFDFSCTVAPFFSSRWYKLNLLNPATSRPSACQTTEDSRSQVILQNIKLKLKLKKYMHRSVTLNVKASELCTGIFR